MAQSTFLVSSDSISIYSNQNPYIKIRLSPTAAPPRLLTDTFTGNGSSIASCLNRRLSYGPLTTKSNPATNLATATKNSI